MMFAKQFSTSNDAFFMILRTTQRSTKRNLCYEANRLHAIVHLQLKLKVAHEHISQPSFDRSLMRKFQRSSASKRLGEISF